MEEESNEFLCEVFLRLYRPGHCPFPGTVVRHMVYRGKQLRTILCGEHVGVFEGWETSPIQVYRERHELVPDDVILGVRIWPSPDITCFEESASNSETRTELNMWTAMHRAVKSHACWRYWLGHYAAYPVPVNRGPLQDSYGNWQRAKDHAEGMYRTYAREDHGQEYAELPEGFLHSIACKAAENLRSRKVSQGSVSHG
ncbi:hypothetical protein [Streptomyces sp. NPDC051662]|uniref:hypothetical protein n=1 Tax=Streptomyces sp. NPDC051662 TaxID=3154750 RepID=UPI003427E415